MLLLCHLYTISQPLVTAQQQQQLLISLQSTVFSTLISLLQLQMLQSVLMDLLNPPLQVTLLAQLAHHLAPTVL
jgi:hypothetical protein